MAITSPKEESTRKPICCNLDESHPSIDVITCYYKVDQECVNEGLIDKINDDGTFSLKNGEVEKIEEWNYVELYHRAFLKYKGLWKNEEKNGYGTEYYDSEEEYYTGEFFNGKCEGYGKYVLDDFEVYGNWKDGKLNGYAEARTDDEYSYKGNWENNERNGRGEMHSSDGDVYDGNWKDDEFDGYGYYQDSDGNHYSGEWKNGLKEGEGTFLYTDGRKYKGHFKNDLKDGYGEYYWTDGDTYKGFWKNGKRHGKGTKIKGNEKKQVVYRFNKKISETI